MTKVDTERFVDGPAKQLVGLRRFHTYEESVSEIPKQWQEFNALGPLAGQQGRTTYGVICGQQPGGFEYFAGVEVANYEELSGKLDRLLLPEQRYAVFVHRGPVSEIRKTWEAIWQVWLPDSGLQPGNTPEFELYDERFDPKTGTGEVEIWFPITGKVV